jgi:hypothetical protein
MAEFRKVPPFNDKNWSFQALGITEETRNKIVYSMTSNETIKKANPFLQGDSFLVDLKFKWIMVEFWTYDMDCINEACEELSKICGCDNLIEGDF